VTGKNPAAKAHHSNRQNCECFRASTKTIPVPKETAGVTIIINIQGKGVADQSFLKALVA
jgi:hypothetical protein